MKGILIGVTALLAVCSTADAQSIGYLMKRADLVVTGQVVEEAGTRRFQMFRLEDIELIKGDLRDTGFRVARFKDIGCQVPLFPGERVLLFLKCLSGEIDGLEDGAADPVFVILAGEQGKLGLVDGQEEAILESARRHAALEALDAQERAAAMVGIFRTALAKNNEALLYSALFDMKATPGAMARMTMEDGVNALERFLKEPSETRLKRRLLHFNGEILPTGLTGALEPLVRSREGCFYRDALAAILARTSDPATPQRLIAGFAALGSVEQENVIHVLGRLGQGKGVSALQTLAAENLETLHVLIIEALKADRTERAVAALAEIAAMGHRKAADAALDALVRINTPAARLHLKAISESSEVRKRVSKRAKELLGLLK